MHLAAAKTIARGAMEMPGRETLEKGKMDRETMDKSMMDWKSKEDQMEKESGIMNFSMEQALAAVDKIKSVNPALIRREDGDLEKTLAANPTLTNECLERLWDMCKAGICQAARESYWDACRKPEQRLRMGEFLDLLLMAGLPREVLPAAVELETCRFMEDVKRETADIIRLIISMYLNLMKMRDFYTDMARKKTPAERFSNAATKKGMDYLTQHSLDYLAWFIQNLPQIMKQVAAYGPLAVEF